MTTADSLTARPSSTAPGSIVKRIFTAVVAIEARHRTRQHLARLDPRMLRDIGLHSIDDIRLF